MKNSTIKKCDRGSNHSETGKVGIKNKLKIIVTSALLLAATNAVAGIVFLPAGGQYTNPELAPVNLQRLDESIIRVHTTGLTGELTLKGSDFPPESDIATTAKVVLPFEQELDLIVDLDEGTVEGRASGQYIATTILNDWIEAVVRGTATCLPLNGLECGQLVVDLELQGVVSDPNDPAIVGKLRMDVLASFYFDGSDVGLGYWAAMSANTTIGGNKGLINSLLSMEEGEVGV